jgi:hypothetical protein
MNDSGTVRGERAIHTQTIERFWSIFHKYIPELQFVTIKGKTLTFSAQRLMLIWRTAVLALGLCLALIGDSLAQSKWPSPPPRPEPSQQEQSHPGGDQQSPAPNQQAAPQLPPIINIMPAPKTGAEAAEERRERGLKAELDRKLVDLTGELAEIHPRFVYRNRNSRRRHHRSVDRYCWLGVLRLSPISRHEGFDCRV